MVAKSFPERRQQPVPVHHLFVAHLLEHLCRRWVSFPQAIRKLAVDAAVFFFRRNCQRQDLFLRQFLEFLEHRHFLEFC